MHPWTKHVSLLPCIFDTGRVNGELRGNQFSIAAPPHCWEKRRVNLSVEFMYPYFF